MQNYYEYLLKSKSPIQYKIQNFPKYLKRQTLSKILVRYELFKKQLKVKGSIIECGVHEGFGIMSWGHFSSILEPYNYHRKIIGFDTFKGFPDISKKDKKTGYSKKGAFKEKYNTYEDLKLAIKNFDSDRFLNKKEKIELVKGDANVTIPRFIKKNKHLVISLLWLDFDIYKPTKTALNFFIPKMAKGSLVVFDELNNPMWPGETTAFFELNKIKYRKLEIFEFEPNVAFLEIL